MSLFLAIFLKLLPLYALIALGYLAGRRLKAERHTVASLLFYILLPIVIFTGVMKTPIDSGVLLLPVVLFAVSSLLCAIVYRLAGLWWKKDSSRNVLALSAGNGNVGYFGLPVAMMFFDEAHVGIYIMALLGVTLYENSVGYYITARGKHSARESVMKVLKLPSLYAFLLGIVCNFLRVPLPDLFAEFVVQVRGAYTILGMMMIGLALATIDRVKPDLRFLAVAFSARFIAWPLTALGLIALDTAHLGLFSVEVHKALFLISIVPLAANSVVIATLLKAQPEKIAFAVVLSTLFALFFVPLMAGWYLS